MSIYQVNGSSLESVANAIRAKAGLSSENKLTFPNGFATAVENMDDGSSVKNDVDKLNSFMEINDFHGNDGVISNTLETPYSAYDVLDGALILNNGTIRQNGTDTNYFVSPLIPVSEGTYGLKIEKNEYGVGNIVANNNGFGFFGSDGETVIARPSEITDLGNDIRLIEVPDGAAYLRFSVIKGDATLQRTIEFFNQWILLPNADSEITDDFFDIGTPKSNGTIEKIKRSDGSYLQFKDQQARDDIAAIDNSNINAFMTNNDLDSDIINSLELPYTEDEIIKFASILSNGSIRNSRNNYDRNCSVTPLIPVTKGTYALYVPNGKGNSNKGQLYNTNDGYGLFGSDGTTPVTKVSMTDLGNNIFQIVVPKNAEYIRFVFYHGYANDNVFFDDNVEIGLKYVNDNWVFIKSDSTTLIPADFKRKANRAVNRLVRADGSTVNLSSTELWSKKILVFGDSIWGNDRTAGISDYLMDYSGATVYNCAIGGTRITGDRSTYAGAPAWQAFDGVHLIHAKLENDFANQDTYASEVTSYVASETLPLLKSIDMSDIDIVILAYGRNDISSDKTVAEITSAYRTAITELLTAYPQLRIIVCTTPWGMFDTVDGDEYTNANGGTLRGMADGVIELGQSMHIEVLDTLARLPWCALTKATYLDSDEVHPSTEGNKVYAHVVHGKLRSMY